MAEREKRTRKPTEKMAAYQEEQFQKKIKKLESTYAKWKEVIREVRRLLKEECSEENLGLMIDDLKVLEESIINQLTESRESGTVHSSLVRKVDACIAINKDMINIMSERLCEIETFDAEREQKKLRNLRKNEYAKSIFSSISANSNVSRKSCLSEKLIEAAADFAAKQVSHDLLYEEETQRLKLSQLESKREMKVAQARLNAYEKAASDNDQLLDRSVKQEHMLPLLNQEPNINADHQQTQRIVSSSSSTNDVQTLANAFAESVQINRLPVPEPSVFKGDPLNFMEWKISLELLIERKGISPREKLFYLHQYVGGPAKKAIQGFCYSDSNNSYESAMNILHERYGHPFIIQKAYRDTLEKWTKISTKDPLGLREFGDFLQGCKDAIPHVPSLAILNDCSENQKLITKLPDWAIVRWNREVAESLERTNTYPTFNTFVNFVVKEAKVACNPVSSLYALSGSSKKTSNHANVLTTNVFQTKSKGTDYEKHCEFCSRNDHYIFKCAGFLALTIEQKRVYIRDNHLCFGCLRKGHINKICTKKHTCYSCRGKHPTCLHDDNMTGNQHRQLENQTFSKVVNANSLRVSRAHGHSTTMIVPVWLSSDSNPNKRILTYALLDTQSDTTFILDDTATSLELPCQQVKLNLSTMTAQQTSIDSTRVNDLRVQGFVTQSSVMINHAFTRDFIPADRSHIPTSETARLWPHLQSIVDEIPHLQSCDVGLLIGCNCPQALAPRKIVLGKDDEPYAIQTLLGWSIVGNTDQTSSEKSTLTSICHRTAVTVKELPPCTPRDLIKVLEHDFQDKDTGKNVSQDDIQFLSLLNETIKENEDHHLQMPLPFKERPEMPNNRPLAVLRLSHLKRKLQRDEKYHEHYKNFMNEILQRGDAELVTDKGHVGNTWYIPHHGVYHSKKANKLRVVFDCSAIYKGTALNHHLMSGPDLANGLVGVLCRFRRHQNAVMCDIEKMFHQFIVPETDRDFLRFLWWENSNVNTEPLEYRMKVHLFGAASSPGCANYGLKHLAKTQEHEYPSASSFVQNDFYVDDGLTSLDTEEEAIQLIKDARILCAKGGLRLHKFISNSKKVLNSIPLLERATNVTKLDLSLDKLPMERALGVSWSTEEDVFKFDISIKKHETTRRNMLSIVASIFDPIGFIAPFTLTGKKILQHMCQHGIGWDDPLPSSIQPEWDQWIGDIHNLQTLSIPRHLKPTGFRKPYVIELHHFSDASTVGYGQCSYVRYSNESQVHCSLLIAKSRVAPQKMVTIPRLELTAAVLSAKMSAFLKDELNLEVHREYFWTDSQVVLGYINNESRRFHVFVANRVQVIRQFTRPEQWYYISTNENPADHTSRGLSAFDIQTSTWLQGPDFLWKKEIKTHDIDLDLQLGDPEVRAVRTLATSAKERSNADILDRFTTISRWSTLISIVARIQRLANGIKGTHSPSVDERHTAERTILRLLQQEFFSDSISALKSTSNLPKGDILYPLNPILCGDLLCVGGRLRKASLQNQYKHPVILPKDSHVTRMILRDVHQRVCHQGRGITLNKLRTSGYWIISGSKTVANFLRQCVVCRKLRRPLESQRMADLPTERVDPTPPFTYCGMDCFGPFITKHGRKETKRYGLLFTCMCCRAVHIEILDDMTTDAFINALRCFIAIRGAVRQIRSDQGTNFIGARNEFEKARSVNKLTAFLSNNQCEFVTNVPYASHTGGVWERQIRTVRNILDSVLQMCPGRMDDSSLRTMFYEAASIVNCRPLSVSEIDDSDALEPLTPNHILTCKSDVPLPPPGVFVKEDLFLRKRWRRVQYLLEQFWSRWRREYVSQISQRQKWLKPKRNMCTGDIVLVSDLNLPRNQWPIARVVEATADDDGLVRKVRVRLGCRDSVATKSILERSVHKLVLLLEH